jgi:hypothetical protein
VRSFHFYIRGSKLTSIKPSVSSLLPDVCAIYSSASFILIHSLPAAAKLFADFLSWAHELERSRPIRTLQRPRRVALMVVE